MKGLLPEPIHVDELVVNWHILEACNYRCRYCYAHWETMNAPEIWRTDQWETLLADVWEFFDPNNETNPLRKNMQWKSVRLSLAGGEPTLLNTKLIDIARKGHELGFKVAIISNGSKLNEKYLAELTPLLSIMGLSVDATDSEVNAMIGRTDHSKSLDIDALSSIAMSARDANPAITIKINTVINAANANIDFHRLIERICPDRWKVMRMLPVTSNDLSISNKTFELFLERHKSLASLMSVESNDAMQQSYIMLDPHGRFFQNANDGPFYVYSESILSVGVLAAMQQVPFSPSKFAARYKPETAPIE